MQRRRSRDPRRDRQTILGGLLLGLLAIAALVATVTLAWRLDVATEWPLAGWVAIALLLAVLLSLVVLFARDYVRLRRAGS